MINQCQLPFLFKTAVPATTHYIQLNTCTKDDVSDCEQIAETKIFYLRTLFIVPAIKQPTKMYDFSFKYKQTTR